ncbi:hypothetical protein ThvES_00018220 [Thiovulum sp. ES]|nr:hypothetical protein ThvES_00018220 [Thiovulum sp. ES]
MKMSKIFLALLLSSAFLNAGDLCQGAKDTNSLLKEADKSQKELETLLASYENREIDNGKFQAKFKPEKEKLDKINSDLKCLNHETRLLKIGDYRDPKSGVVLERAYQFAKKSNKKMLEEVESKIKDRKKNLDFMNKKGLFSFAVAEENEKIFVKYYLYCGNGNFEKKTENFSKPIKKNISTYKLGNSFMSFNKKAVAYEIENQLWYPRAKPYSDFKKENKLKTKAIDPKRSYEQKTCSAFSNLVAVVEIDPSLREVDCLLRDGDYTLKIRDEYHDEYHDKYSFKNGEDEMKIRVPHRVEIVVVKDQKNDDEKEIPERTENKQEKNSDLSPKYTKWACKGDRDFDSLEKCEKAFTDPSNDNCKCKEIK